MLKEFPMSSDIALKDQRFNEIISIIENARSRALKAVNSELIQMYWQIGEYVSKQVKNGE
jgi:hypothetical protein